MAVVKFSPIGNEVMWFSNTGLIANGGKLFFYEANSSTKLDTYSSSAGSVANSNPIVLSAYGKSANQIWLQDGYSYKVVLAPAADTDPPASGVTLGDYITGINDTGDTASITQWTASGFTVSYVSATSLAVVGDETSTLHVGRRIKTTNTGGTIYSTITASSYSAPSTSLTVVNDSGSLDSGLSALSYGILSSVNPSIPKAALPDGSTATTQAINDNSTKLATTAYVDTISNTVKIRSAVRQSVNFAPVTSAGLPNLSGSTGSTTVTTSNISSSAPFIVNAANGMYPDYIGTSTSDLSWTGLSTNGTMYLYVDVSAAGVLTTGSVTLAPVYQYGGTPSTTANQCTFNIQQMQMFVGNGSTAPQTYRVFVGEVEVAGNVTTSITWYALNGYYDSGYTNTLPSTAALVSYTHNIGCNLVKSEITLKCVSGTLGYTADDVILNPCAGGTAYAIPLTITNLAKVSKYRTGDTVAYVAQNYTTGVPTGLTAVNWAYRMTVRREF